MAHRCLFLGIALVATSTLGGFSASAQLGAPVTRQTSRQITDAISERIAQEVIDAERRASAWYNFAYNHGEGDGGLPGLRIEGDAYQNILGGDWNIGSFYVGASVTYAYADLEVSVPFFGTSDFDSNVIGIAPYGAWVANDHFFATLLGGYQLVTTDEAVFGLNIPDIHTGFYDIGLNGLWSGSGEAGQSGWRARLREGLELLGKAGFRHEIVSDSQTGTDNFFTLTAGGSVGFRMGIFKPYARLWYEAFIDADGGSTTSSGFGGGGAKLDVTDRINVGLEAWSNFGDPELDELQASLTLTALF